MPFDGPIGGPEPAKTEEELKERVRKILSDPDKLEEITEQIYDDLIEDAVLGIVFEVHREAKLGGIPAMNVEEAKEFIIPEDNKANVFASEDTKKKQETSCPNCSGSIMAARFSPHLEKCLGMGRNSSRIASRRIAGNSKEGAFSEDIYADWISGLKKAKKSDGKKKKDKAAGGKQKTQFDPSFGDYGQDSFLFFK